MKSATAYNEVIRSAALMACGVILANDVGMGAVASRDVSAMHGTVCLANDSILRETEPIEELTSFAIAYDSQVGNGLVKLRDLLAPPRESSSRIVRLTTYDENEPFQTVDYTKVKRPMLGDFARVTQRTASKSDLQINNRGLTILLDRDQLVNKPDWETMHTKWLIDLLNRATVLESIAILEAAATQSNTVWDAASNPDLEIRQDILTQSNITGFYPNTVVYGDQAELKRANAYESQLTAGSIARASLYTEAQLATALRVTNVLVNAERYASAANAAAKQEFLGSVALVLSSYEESPMDATNLVRHVANAARGGGNYAVYQKDVGVKLVAITVENYEYLHLQHSTGLQQININ